MAGLGVAAGDAVGADHPGQALLTLGTQIQVVLEQQPQQLASVGLQAVLEGAVVEVGRPATVQEAHQILEPCPAAGEVVIVGAGQWHGSS